MSRTAPQQAGVGGSPKLGCPAAGHGNGPMNEIALARESAAADRRRAGPATLAVLGAWVLAGAVVSGAGHLRGIGRPFCGWEGWMSAHFATMARSFRRHGVIALGGVPVQNNPPLGAQVDAYVHWPPLLPIVLSGAFAAFGESEAVARGLTLALLAGMAGLTYLLLAAAGRRAGGPVAVAAMLGMPVVAEWGLTVLHLHLALLGALAAAVCYVKAAGDGAQRRRGLWAAAGAAALVCGVAASWEAALLCPGLLAAAAWSRRRRQVALAGLYCAVAVAAAGGVVALYWLRYPGMMEQLFRTALWRVGLADFRPDGALVHSLLYEQVRGVARPGAWQKVQRLYEYSRLIGLAPLLLLMAAAAVGGVAAAVRRRPGALFAAAAGLLGICVLWLVGMGNHWYYHPYQMLMAVPAAAVACGVAGDAVLSAAALRRRRAARAALWLAGAVALPACLLLPLAIHHPADRPRMTRRVAAALAVRRHTPPNAVVLSPDTNMVTVYYADRHVIRGAAGDAAIASVLPRVVEAFPGSPVYFACTPGEHDERLTAATVAAGSAVYSGAELVLVRLSPRAPPAATAGTAATAPSSASGPSR